MGPDHILPRRVYYTIFAILLACTYLTVQMAFFDLGRLNAVVALAIAGFKALLVVLFFMHLRYSTRLTWVVVIGAIFWLMLLLALTAGDYLTRPFGTYGTTLVVKHQPQSSEPVGSLRLTRRLATDD
jgi:cytochrome c oxidase subunit IV